MIRLSLVGQYGFDPFETDEIPYASYLWYVGALNGESALSSVIYNRRLTAKEASDHKLTPSQMADRVRWQAYLKSVKTGRKYQDPLKQIERNTKDNT